MPTDRALSAKMPCDVRREPTPVYTNRLQCVECGRVSRENERGSTARLTMDDEVLVYCPECDELEFGAEA